MLDIVPLLAWLPAATSAVVLFVLWRVDGIGPGWVALAVVCAVAFGLQLRAPSLGWSSVGLGLQTVLAVSLVIRLRLSL